MTLKQPNKKIDFLVEQKLSELLGDPDSFLSLDKLFLKKLKTRLGKKPNLVSHSQVLKKYGFNF
jgi:hypothetical protein